MARRPGRRLLAGVCLLAVALAGCDRGGDATPTSGTVTDKKLDPPRCGAWNKQHQCTHRIPTRYEICFEDGKKHTCRTVPQHDWERYKVGDHYPAS
ncbi:hypothetical protein [Micromonospora auratinigra]|uniref:Lipoprotein n=1 Tax=Micromonospora auratinigra TaxID=261654 RepID=A0A1A8ZFX9_9ACTN|nr:hypothetical protein [Micromonospora auratinigra]SBT42917.1 hypothetical protein GA0070611_2131 [Micromonospora auratinigra]